MNPHWPHGVVLVILTTAPILGQAPAPGKPSLALLQDAASYADQYGVELDEAVRRLQLQHEIGDLDAALSKEERDSFAGLWIEHEPEYRVIVRFTNGSGQERLRARLAGRPLEHLLEMRPARWSLADLAKRQAVARGQASRAAVSFNSDVNVFDNQVELFVVDHQKLLAGLARAGLRLPEGVEIIPVPRLAELETALTGGVPLSTCTGGFTVRAANGDAGISTAGHCAPNPGCPGTQGIQSFQGVELPFRSEDCNGDQDVQWHSACNLFDVTNQFNSGIGLRSCIGTRHRDNQAIGSYLCKWGMTTERTCGTIQSKNFDLGSNHNATFIRVDGGATNLSEPGDSGGPWFVEDLAFGTHVGAPGDDGNDSIYMAINYISSLGVSVLTFDPGCGDGLCDAPCGESSSTCPSDCPTTCTVTASCSNAGGGSVSCSGPIGTCIKRDNCYASCGGQYYYCPKPAATCPR